MSNEASAAELEQIRDYLVTATVDELASVAKQLAEGVRVIRGITVSDFQAGYICAQCASLHMEHKNGECPKVVPIVRLFNPPKS